MIVREEVGRKVYECVAETFEFPVDKLEDSMNSSDIDGWDSISTSYLILSLEEKFDAEFPVDALVASENLGEMIDLICTTING